MDNNNESRREWLLRAFMKAGKNLKRISKYKLWQDGNHPVCLETNRFIDVKVDFIHHNPVEAEIVDEPEYYWYSSARYYFGIKGLLAVDFID